jgi:hypothetical protein
MAIMLKKRGERMLWYQDELLHMAKELGHRLLPAFNTSSGLPFPIDEVNNQLQCINSSNAVWTYAKINFDHVGAGYLALLQVVRRYLYI